MAEYIQPGVGPAEEPDAEYIMPGVGPVGAAEGGGEPPTTTYFMPQFMQHHFIPPFLGGQ